MSVRVFCVVEIIELRIFLNLILDSTPKPKYVSILTKRILRDRRKLSPITESSGVKCSQLSLFSSVNWRLIKK